MIGLLIITHETIGEAYRKLAHHFFPGGLPENVRMLGVQPTEDQDDIINNAIAALQEFPDNDGVLLMTDIFCLTPCNAARCLVRENKSAILTVLHAPMMVKAVQYSTAAEDLAAFTECVSEAAVKAFSPSRPRPKIWCVGAAAMPSEEAAGQENILNGVCCRYT